IDLTVLVLQNDGAAPDGGLFGTSNSFGQSVTRVVQRCDGHQRPWQTTTTADIAGGSEPFVSGTAFVLAADSFTQDCYFYNDVMVRLPHGMTASEDCTHQPHRPTARIGGPRPAPHPHARFGPYGRHPA